MVSNVIDFNGTTTLWEPPDSVLEKAKGQFQDGSNVLIIGLGKDGELWFGGNCSNLAEIVLLLAQAQKAALEV